MVTKQVITSIKNGLIRTPFRNSFIVSTLVVLDRRDTRNQTHEKLILDALDTLLKSFTIKSDASCVKNATKTKKDLRTHLLAGLSLSVPDNAFLESVALSHVLKNELKWNPLKSRLIRGFWVYPKGFELSTLRVGV